MHLPMKRLYHRGSQALLDLILHLPNLLQRSFKILLNFSQLIFLDE
jgi:hypothetical protein